jgi:acyl-CoA thioesterase FadM
MGFLETSILKLRVWPTDIDLLLHMNNGVYLSLMDLGRTDLTLRSGFYRILRKNGIYPVIASEVIRFKKSLKPFQSFEIHTDLIYWDEKYFYLQQRFFSRKELYASGIVKARFLRNEGGGVDPLEIFRLLGLSQTELDQSLSRLAQEGKDAIVSYRGIENYLR